MHLGGLAMMAGVGFLTSSAIVALIGGSLLTLRKVHYKKLRAQGVEVDKLDAPS